MCIYQGTDILGAAGKYQPSKLKKKFETYLVSEQLTPYYIIKVFEKLFLQKCLANESPRFDGTIVKVVVGAR